MYFNLKDDASESKFIEKLSEYFAYLQGRVDGLGPSKLYQHHAFGANPRTYQMFTEFQTFSTWDRYVALIETDAELARLSREWHNLIDLKTHYDEFLREILAS
jgi:hypothetical protein